LARTVLAGSGVSVLGQARDKRVCPVPRGKLVYRAEHTSPSLPQALFSLGSDLNKSRHHVQSSDFQASLHHKENLEDEEKITK